MCRSLHGIRAGRALTCFATARSHLSFTGRDRTASDVTSKSDIRRETMLRRTRQKGVATVEFAIVAPIVFFLVLALFQFAGLLMNQNVLSAAAREGARVASLPGTTSEDDVVAKVEERLSRGGIYPNVVDVDVNPEVLSNLNSGEAIRVSVTSPMNKMVWIGPFIPSNLNVSAQFACERE